MLGMAPTDDCMKEMFVLVAFTGRALACGLRGSERVVPRSPSGAAN